MTALSSRTVPTLSPAKDTAGGDRHKRDGNTGVFLSRKRVEKRHSAVRTRKLSWLFFMSFCYEGHPWSRQTAQDGIDCGDYERRPWFQQVNTFLLMKKKGTIKGAIGVGPASS